MVFGNMESEDLLNLTMGMTEQNVVDAIKYINENGVPPRRTASSTFIIYNNEKYPLKYVFEVVNNVIMNNSTKIGTGEKLHPDTWTLSDVLQKLIPAPTMFKIVTPYNKEGAKIIDVLRSELIAFSESIGITKVEDPKDYTALKLNKNIAEIHRIKKNKNEFDVYIKYNILPESLIQKAKVKRVNSNYKWALDGGFCVQNEDQLEIAKEIIEYISRTGENRPVDKEILKDLVTKFAQMVFEEHTPNDYKFSDFDEMRSVVGFRGTPYFALVGYQQDIRKGIYPLMLVDKSSTGFNFEICYGVSSADTPKINWQQKSVNGLNPSSTSYKKCLVKESFNVNNISDFNNNADQIAEVLSDIISEYKKIFEGSNLNSNENEGKKMTKHIPLNQILYGPPGTGKTYNTVIEAMKIIKNNPELKINNNAEYQHLKEEFDKLKQQGRIEFVTFHQSYSYEEFVEGIRPVLDSGDVKYNLHEGVFKQICNKDKKISFNDIFEKFKELHKEGTELKTAYHNNPFVLEEYRENNIKIKNQNGLIHYKDLEQAYNDDIYCSFKSRNEIALKYSNITDTEVLSEIYVIVLILRNLKKSIENSNYVLIIDEINRGNISKILGELITLLEDNKRVGEGQEEALTVTLPYSKQEFGVPKNLYIIGTMNTSDRSIASVDIALRRRFIFKEIMPDSKHVPIEIAGLNANFREIYELMNKKISILLDREHQIGHSYFMKIKTVEDLKTVWFNNIIPLLNEYFYGEWDKLKEIIPTFVKAEKTSDLIGAPDLAEEDYYDFYQEEDFNVQMKFEDAIINLYATKNKAKEGQEALN